MSSQYIFNEPNMKSRLIRKYFDWYIGEYKTPVMETWFPWIAGTADLLALSEQDRSWAKNV